MKGIGLAILGNFNAFKLVKELNDHQNDLLMFYKNTKEKQRS